MSLQHVDLSATGLTKDEIKEIGSCLKKTGSLQAIHLSQNPGIDEEIIQFLSERLKCIKSEEARKVPVYHSKS